MARVGRVTWVEFEIPAAAGSVTHACTGALVGQGAAIHGNARNGEYVAASGAGVRASIYTAAVTAWNPDTAGEVTFYFSSGTGYVSRDDEAPAATWYEPRISQPAFMRRDAFGSRRTSGRSTISFGELVLANPDGELDYLADYDFDGRAINLKIGTLAQPGAPTWTTVLSGTIQQAMFGWKSVTIRIRDRQIELDKAFQTTKYAGTNALPAGLEGTADDLLGQPKPRCYGVVFNIAPPCVNTSKLIFQVNDGAVYDVDAVYDQGATLTKGTAYTDEADMMANAPSVSNYRVWKAGGCFRLGSSPAGQITADATQGATAADRTVAQIVEAVVVGPGGIDPADVSAADIAALDTANSAVVGVWAGNETTCAEVLDVLANSLGCFWGFDKDGMFRVRQLLAPSGDPVLSLTTTENLSIERAQSKDDDQGIPAWRVVLAYKRFWQTQTDPIAGSVSAARRAELGNQYRYVVAEDASVKAAHPLAVELAVETVLTDPGDAAAEAARKLALFKVKRDMYDMAFMIDGATGLTADIGDVMQITLPRYGMNAGRLFRAIGLIPDLRKSRIDMTVWG